MHSKNKILIIAEEIDPSVDNMIIELRQRGVECIRWHTDSFPLESLLKLRIHDENIEGSLRINKRDVNLREIRSVWYRRPAPFKVQPGFSPNEKEFAEGEVREAFFGLVRLANWFWVNHPDKNRIASSKVLQLKVAKDIDLTIPRTLVTNDPREVKQFYEDCNGQMIYKAFRSGIFPGSKKRLLTTSISKECLENIYLIRNTPGIFQKYIPKKVELRITIIGRRVFPVEIHSQDNPQAKHDWRIPEAGDLYHSPHKLPKEVEEKLLRFLDHFDLAFSAIDMILTPDGRYVFIENNPSGQFGWIEELTGLPLTSTLAEMLIAGKVF